MDIVEHDSPEAFAFVVARMQALFGAFLSDQITPEMRIQALYDAHQAGQMTADEAQQYEEDVRSGTMVLPRGAILKTSTQPAVRAAAGVH